MVIITANDHAADGVERENVTIPDEKQMGRAEEE
jgi:hypothetical protein